ncbi:bifunctional serine/threonine-protein kinase/transporter substrate-binding domain-containing protein [Mycolicibacterium sp. 050158]|uniref:bifunctional serine/threonine-protein kinase/transporter substrate-binding domain-containing protein n=1 Tax=Mycolicibacterium sp. 050158 TaxID=3090602 RepID=UPI00299F008B|nr:bifunctional serine/threonine-protein kinase/transporter substrate-binding domain-containing protein [Mycolicibacterium sp. 050158]MDX1888102.1 bifunctional serine/threonine-protein kinase/transporter substrate-binding domain-containing protein [Mycolicibacterium sp. 050158]
MDGTSFGHYQLHELLGRGGMGEVYRAYDTRTERVVALKVLPPHLAADTAFQQRFRRESQAAASLSDPHVVPIHGFGEIDGRLYLDMRLIEGKTLADLLAERKGPVAPELAVAVIEQVGTALDAAHRAGLIHRDVKPSNILVTDREFAYLIDFGLARTADEKGMTTAGNTLGTLAYMAPERFDAGQSDPRSDLYALGCVLYEALTGSRPYPADSLEQQIAGHMVQAPPRPSAFDPKLTAFDAVVAKGMAKKPGQRFQSGAELAKAARTALLTPVRGAGRSGRHSARRIPTGQRPRPTRRVLAVVGAVVLVAALGTFGVWQWRSGTEDVDPRQAAVANSTAPPDPNLPPGAVPSIAATVPADVRATGQLVIGINVPYAPNEFKDSQGTIVGFDVDLMTAVARTLGLKPDYRETAFESIIPSVRADNFDVGASSFTDTTERERNVDFVTYLRTGNQWARRTGTTVDSSAPCGLKVGVAQGGLQQSVEVPAKSDACVAAGLAPIDMVVFTRQDDLTKALIAGDVDAMSADSPVTGFAVKLSAGVLEPAGEVTDPAPYGWPVAKGSGLAEPLKQALTHLIQTGEYRTIATIWGVDNGLIDAPVINGASR